MNTPLTPSFGKPAAAATQPRIRCVLTDSAHGLTEALEAVRQLFPHRFGDSEAVCVRFEIAAGAENTLSVTQEADAGSVLVRATDTPAALRALGILLGRLEAGLPLAVQEQRAFETLGIMLDVSRNAVLRTEALQRLICHMALMGINQLMLYTEDTYEIPGEPLFGYFRGRYTQAELRAIDDYATHFGIEVVPCIQTLGHLEQVLKWTHFKPMQDIGGVLLSGDERTAQFIERMITAASAPFRSKRIHIGMDEADGVGAGIYRVRNGARPAFDILTEHLRATTDTCHRLGLRPMIWSDMFFRLGSETHDYYDRNAVISEQAVARVPEGVDFVYWDYYHSDPAFYSEWIARHRAMGKEPVYAGGIWAWNRWWTQLKHTLRTLEAGMSAARQNNVKEAVATIWGDDGMEADLLSTLPGIQFFAEMGYGTAEAARANLATNLRGSCAISAQPWIDASDLDLPPVADPGQFYHANPSKWLLWHDPLLGFLDKHVPASFAPYYAELATRFARDAVLGAADARLNFPARIAEVLSLKCELHHALRPAYAAGDREALSRLLRHTLPELHAAVTRLRSEHETLWNGLYRVFGWEALERRYAALLARLDTLARKLTAYLDNQTPIEELAEGTVRLWEDKDFFNTTLRHHHVASGSCIL